MSLDKFITTKPQLDTSQKFCIIKDNTFKTFIFSSKTLSYFKSFKTKIIFDFEIQNDGKNIEIVLPQPFLFDSKSRINFYITKRCFIVFEKKMFSKKIKIVDFDCVDSIPVN